MTRVSINFSKVKTKPEIRKLIHRKCIELTQSRSVKLQYHYRNDLLSALPILLDGKNFIRGPKLVKLQRGHENTLSESAPSLNAEAEGDSS